jgi:CD2 antigen cytoplasmic tail-binding protein 2
MFASTSAGVAGTTNAPDLDAKDNDTRVKDTGLELKGQAGKGGKEFLDLGDIEGQEFTSSEAYDSANKQAREDMEKARKVYEDQEDYVEGEEHANDDDAVVPQERKDAEGMGFTISKFNMQEEMQEGRFSVDGSKYLIDKERAILKLTLRDFQITRDITKIQMLYTIRGCPTLQPKI